MKFAKLGMGLTCAGLLLSASLAYGNAPPPPPRVERAVVRTQAPVEIAYEPVKGASAIIRIPRNLLPKMTAEEAAPRSAPRAAPQSAPQPEKQSSKPYGGTLIAGLALSLAAVSIVVLLKRGATTRTLAAVMFAGGLAVVAAGTVLADIRVPGQPYNGPARRPELDLLVPAERIIIEIVEEGKVVTLSVTPAKTPK